MEDNENNLYSYIYKLYYNCCLLNIKYIEKIDEKYIKELSQEESIIYYLKRIELYIDLENVRCIKIKNTKKF